MQTSTHEQKIEQREKRAAKTKQTLVFFSGEFWPMPGRFLAGGANRSIPTIEEGEG